jgi:hypothetical protein
MANLFANHSVAGFKHRISSRQLLVDLIENCAVECSSDTIAT